VKTSNPTHKFSHFHTKFVSIIFNIILWYTLGSSKCTLKPDIPARNLYEFLIFPLRPTWQELSNPSRFLCQYKLWSSSSRKIPHTKKEERPITVAARSKSYLCPLKHWVHQFESIRDMDVCLLLFCVLVIVCRLWPCVWLILSPRDPTSCLEG
jgi:hypothetical protein